MTRYFLSDLFNFVSIHLLVKLMRGLYFSQSTNTSLNMFSVMFSYLQYDEWSRSRIDCINSVCTYLSILIYSPTVLDGCTDAALSSDFCFLSLSLSLRRWQRWWWWWWWALSWPWTCPGPVDDCAKLGRSRSYSFSPSSWRYCCVSEDAERLIGLRSTIGWEGKRLGGGVRNK